jgi:prolyl-tRNA synthetase
VRIVADNSTKDMVNFITGANKKDAHLINVNFDNNFETKEFADLRTITKDDPCPACGKTALELKQTIEVGHTFKLGTKYSEVLGAKYLDKDGKENVVVMGCYGIGVNRILATVIESSNDKDGIIWPLSIAPYQIVLLSLNPDSKKVKELSDSAYDSMLSAGYEVLYDDRNDSAGSKFKDADLIGIPIKVIVGEKNAKKGMIEVKDRKTAKVDVIKSEELLAYLGNIISGKTA